MGIRRGGQQGALAPLGRQKIFFFSTFLDEKSMFLGIFLANSMYLPPPLENFALPWKKVCGSPW